MGFRGAAGAFWGPRGDGEGEDWTHIKDSSSEILTPQPLAFTPVSPCLKSSRENLRPPPCEGPQVSTVDYSALPCHGPAPAPQQGGLEGGRRGLAAALERDGSSAVARTNRAAGNALVFPSLPLKPL